MSISTYCVLTTTSQTWPVTRLPSFQEPDVPVFGAHVLIDEAHITEPSFTTRNISTEFTFPWKRSHEKPVVILQSYAFVADVPEPVTDTPCHADVTDCTTFSTFTVSVRVPAVWVATFSSFNTDPVAVNVQPEPFITLVRFKYPKSYESAVVQEVLCSVLETVIFKKLIDLAASETEFVHQSATKNLDKFALFIEIPTDKFDVAGHVADIYIPVPVPVQA